MRKEVIVLVASIAFICLLTLTFNFYARGITGNVIANFSANITGPIVNLSSNIYVCENNYLESNFTIFKKWAGTLTVRVSPSDLSNPFVVLPSTFTSIGTSSAQLVSFSALSKGFLGTYPETVMAENAGTTIDSKATTIEVIEINNAPSITNIQNMSGIVNTSVYFQVTATDTEDGNQNSGNLSFNVTFLSPTTTIFTINNSGVISFTPSDSQAGTYLLRVCVNDSGFNASASSSAICSQTNSSLYDCENFTLTITEIPPLSLSETGGAKPAGGGGGAEVAPQCYIPLDKLEAGTKTLMLENQVCILSFGTKEYNMTLKIFDKKTYIVVLGFKENAESDLFTPIEKLVNFSSPEVQAILQLGDNSTIALDNDNNKLLLLRFEDIWNDKAGIYIKKIKYTEIPPIARIPREIVEIYKGLDERQREILWLFIIILIILIIIVLAIIIWLMIRERKRRELERKVRKEIYGYKSTQDFS